MSAKNRRPGDDRTAAKDRCDATSAAKSTADLRHSLMSRNLSEFADARAALRIQFVCVRFAESVLDRGPCDVAGRVRASDRTGLLLVTPGHFDLDGSEVVSLIPWVAIEHVTVGWAEDVLPEEVLR